MTTDCAAHSELPGFLTLLALAMGFRSTWAKTSVTADYSLDEFSTHIFCSTLLLRGFSSGSFAAAGFEARASFQQGRVLPSSVSAASFVSRSF